MKNSKNNYFLFFSFFALLSVSIISCSDNKEDLSQSFDPITNFGDSDTISLQIDLEKAVLNGIEIPSTAQDSDGKFDFKFDFSTNGKEYFYKIFYQNESYKFPETDGGELHPYCHENFYGSWQDVSIGFKPIIENETKDNFRIVGNPRDEKVFYGADLEKIKIDSVSIAKIKNAIRNTPDWFASIEKKAADQNRKVEQQLFLDAVWMIKASREDGDFNHRWKRNPRVGCYSFLLVVVEKEALKAIPEEIKNIGLTQSDGTFLNPFYYFLYGEGKNMEGVFVGKSSKVLKVNATLKPTNGVFFNPATQRDEHIDTQFENDLCNSSDKLYKSAHFEQFMHAIDRNYFLYNIPEAHDVIGEPYTQEDFYNGRKKYDSTQVIIDHTQNSICPCQTVSVDKEKDAIVLRNPGNDDPNNLRKENVGVKTRIGFTYGKFQGKIKFPELLNEENVWNGLTNAFWMIYQGEHDWCKRRVCQKDGFIPKNARENNGKYERVNQLNYSEIDIEIVKTSPTWKSDEYRKDDGRNSGDVMYCCTNWDLACPEPEDFAAGRSNITYKGTEYELHRWTDHYRALTLKHPENDNELFQNDFYYFEIEWKPTEIIWRVGPDPENMRICGYMNDKVTMIPNNQMVCIITQEFHYAKWWPFQPYSQDYVPYPKNDIEGLVYEINIK